MNNVAEDDLPPGTLAWAELMCVGPPTYEEWMSRRATFDDFGRKYYMGIGRDTPARFKYYERELERCWCASAFTACILVADAAIGVLLLTPSPSDRQKIRKGLRYIEDPRQRIRRLRNSAFHQFHPIGDFVKERERMMGFAREACSLVYHVARAYTSVDVPETPTDTCLYPASAAGVEPELNLRLPR